MANSMVEIRDFLSTPENPVSPKEMIEFWKDLSEEEKEQYRTAKLD